jgi:formamidopyrimidine-DNA glycosylase
MNAHVVVGVGNIYASEALWRAGIHPTRPAGRIAAARYAILVRTVKEVLEDSLRAGGTTLRDYTGSDGAPGRYRISLDVYEREGLACPRCGDRIRRRVVAQRSTYFCASCQR